MNDTRPVRIAVVTDKTAATPELLAAMRERAARGSVQFRILIPNPAHAEAHLLHPERHDKAMEAERVLHDAISAFEAAAGGPVIGSVSIRHDPYDAIEELMLSEPIDEIFVSLATHDVTRWLHLDLPHRLKHFGLPVTVVAEPALVPTG
jgi:hypothetical protein